MDPASEPNSGGTIGRHSSGSASRLTSDVNAEPGSGDTTAAYRPSASTPRSNALLHPTGRPAAATLQTSRRGAVSGAVTQDAPSAWGWLPYLTLTSALGLLLSALSDQAGRISQRDAEPLFWCGVLLIVLPVAYRLVFALASSYERLGLSLLLAIAIYTVKVLQYPVAFTFHDEYAHWRTAADIASTHHLFSANPIIPISTDYPGLEIFTNALSSMTGLPIFASGVLVIGVARLLLALALFLLYEAVSGSSRVAGIGSFLYAMNPHFLFFDSSYSYESFALPLAVLVVTCLVLRARLPLQQRSESQALTAIAWVSFAGVVVTHHLTSYALAGFLLLWSCVAYYLRRRGANLSRSSGISPGLAPLVGIELIVLWVFTAGSAVISYLSPHLIGSLQAIIALALGHGQHRQLFTDFAGSVTPLWARAAAFGAVILIFTGAALGLWRIWRRYHHALALSLALATLLYPVSQAFRLTQAGSESADRATEFLFLGMAFALAVYIVDSVLPTQKLLAARNEAPRATMLRWHQGPQVGRAHYLSAGLLACMLVLIIGGVVAGGGPEWNWVPGPYLVSADSHSIEPEGITAAQWMRAYVGPRRRVASDRINSLLMGSYGEEDVLTSLYAHTQIAPLFTSAHLGLEGLRLIERTRAQYIVVDTRMSTQLPRLGIYFDSSEPNKYAYTQPIASGSLEKFDHIAGMNRIFDSGDISIYQVAI